jgi:3-deoxy-alpha-D-manno-octulosonate 8-oxidase
MRITRFIPAVLFGEKRFDDLNEFVDGLFAPKDRYSVYLIDSVHQKTGLRARLKPRAQDLVLEVNASAHEPKTQDVDAVRDEILKRKAQELPRVVIGIGGGSTMDVAKAVSVMLTNPGSSADYQGWDLVKNKPVPKIAVPTLSGTGAEATRTAVLTGPIKKLGINSDYSIYDAVLMDPELLKSVPVDQELYTGMDNFIHCVESINGSAMNPLGKPFALQAKVATENFFLKEKNYAELMVGSFLGGCSIANSSVGICHALSYGIAFILGYRHGIANTIVFSQLEEYYGEDVLKLRKMLEKNKVKLPTGVTRGITPEQLDRMIQLTYMLERDLISALGPDFKKILTPDKISRLYERM